MPDVMANKSRRGDWMKDPENRKRAMDARAKRLSDRNESRALLAPGVAVFKDCKPGTGWVLKRFGYADRFLATRELAISNYEELCHAQAT